MKVEEFCFHCGIEICALNQWSLEMLNAQTFIIFCNNFLTCEVKMCCRLQADDKMKQSSLFDLSSPHQDMNLKLRPLKLWTADTSTPFQRKHKVTFQFSFPLKSLILACLAFVLRTSTDSFADFFLNQLSKMSCL